MSAVITPAEAAEYYFRYIDLVPEGEIVRLMTAQHDALLVLLRGLPEARAGHRYGADKWSIREVVSHLTDTERVFAYRAFWFARAYDSELPSFDEATAAAHSHADARAWEDLVDEFDAVRRASITLFRHLDPTDMTRRGIASGNPVSVRALAYLIVGHVEHHVRILRDRYGVA